MRKLSDRPELGPASRSSWLSLRALLAGFLIGAIAGVGALGLLLLIDALVGSDIATDSEGSSVIASVVMLLVFVVVYGAVLERVRRD